MRMRLALPLYHDMNDNIKDGVKEREMVCALEIGSMLGMRMIPKSMFGDISQHETTSYRAPLVLFGFHRAAGAIPDACALLCISSKIKHALIV